MTTGSSNPQPRQSPVEVSSSPILRAVLKWGGIVMGALAVLGAVIGYLVDGPNGLWSALVGIVLGGVFLGITAGSILIANRWFGTDLYVPIFFAIVLGGWIIKFVIFLVVILVLKEQPWVNPVIMFLAIVFGVLGSLVVDALVLLRMRLPYVSDVKLPGDDDDEEEIADEEAESSKRNDT
ncbi:MAG TPA: hypothetical protein PLA13_03320 [Microbacteriaceae bacterium]|jgi:hypothetical protein|nr:hypothetical protein [Microbacteriaceae bacterium]HQX35366.1 hypothetical protein [Microbacteriaceae bacterium]HQZ48498.1 hypothetical protein [Microbacteriaceae bacterium]HRA09814.1 hypothetical protein [Microbacteriaceae bacterium]